MKNYRKLLIFTFAFFVLISSPAKLFAGGDPEYTLTITPTPAEGGTVTKDPDIALYIPGTVVTLEAKANTASGWSFSGWSGNLSGSINPTTITMDSDKTVQANFANNLVAHWEFNEGDGSVAYDSAGDNDGNIYDATWTTGKIGGALEFDGDNDYVRVPDSENLDFSTGDMAISLWIKPADLGAGGILGKYDNWREYNYAIWYVGEVLYFEVGNSSDAYGTEFETVVSSIDVNTANQWYHIVGTYDHNNVKLYVNGQEVDSKSENRDLGVGTGPLCIGNVRYDGVSSDPSNEIDDYFHGKIDDVRIYDRALSDVEVEELYHEGLDDKAFNPNPANVAANVDPNGILSWSAGKDALSHDVYLGTNFDDVNDANTFWPEFKGNQTATSYDPYGLDVNTTYYWRIDEVGDSNTYKGDVWSFTTWIEPKPDLAG